MISLKQLRYLDALAETGHFGRAAELAGVTQPALSIQIRELEARLGTELVERHPAGARLTAMGAEIAARGARVLADVREIEDLAKARAGAFAGPLRLGIIPSIAPFLLPRLLPEITKRYPAIDLILRETLTETLMRELVAGDLDLIIASLPLDHPQVETAEAYREAFMLVAAQNGTALPGPLPLSALADQRVLLLEDGHCLRDQVLNACGTSIAGSKRGGGATNLGTLVELVANGQGVTLVPEMYAEGISGKEGRVCASRFTDPEPSRRVALAWRKTHPLAGRFGELRDLVAQCMPR
ncbi:MAG: hydrogen peroxide-inducible genes activator [Novosphingobium sp.]|nr:hydrogen peroxide-inducible genes activator [Novosphingobium sp.]